jgi:hypothetical protein
LIAKAELNLTGAFRVRNAKGTRVKDSNVLFRLQESQQTLFLQRIGEEEEGLHTNSKFIFYIYLFYFMLCSFFIFHFNLSTYYGMCH